MTIDWSKPVETTEDPPRPVRVLFDKDGRPEAAHIADNGSSPSFNLFVLEHIGTGISATRGMYSLPLRNVAPKPVPVLREAWVVFKETPNCWVFTDYAHAKNCADANGFPVARAAVMSDGSPVAGEEIPAAAWKENSDHWKAKAEALQAEVKRLQEVEREWVRVHHCEIKVAQDLLDEARQQRDEYKAEVERLKPVVDAAVAWRRWYERNFATNVGAVTSLIEAVRTYYSQQAPATVGDVLGGIRNKYSASASSKPAEPVKNCTTCRFYAEEEGCGCLLYRHCASNLSAPFHHWEPRHD